VALHPTRQNLVEMAPPKTTPSQGHPKDDSDELSASNPSKASSPKVFSPAKRNHKDFAAIRSSESEGEDAITSPLAKRLKSRGEEDPTKEEKNSTNSSSEDSDGDNVDSEKHENDNHEIDRIEGDDDAFTEEEEDEEVLTCADCGGTPCLWDQLGPEVVAVGVNSAWLDPESENHEYDVSRFEAMNELELNEVHLEHHARRFKSYCTFNRVWPAGGRGKGDARPLPACCDAQISSMYPVPPGCERTGFISSEDRGII